MSKIEISSFLARSLPDSACHFAGVSNAFFCVWEPGQVGLSVLRPGPVPWGRDPPIVGGEFLLFTSWPAESGLGGVAGSVPAALGFAGQNCAEAANRTKAKTAINLLPDINHRQTYRFKTVLRFVVQKACLQAETLIYG